MPVEVEDLDFDVPIDQSSGSRDYRGSRLQTFSVR